ncbi:hypothetical protein [Azospirillum himalayense]|uniref:Uncharacterized protein n=1 Tax=Azospirillum himalayense TaxID=654847 RepID=A0ABW0GCA0_9PROT
MAEGSSKVGNRPPPLRIGGPSRPKIPKQQSNNAEKLSSSLAANCSFFNITRDSGWRITGDDSHQISLDICKTGFTLAAITYDLEHAKSGKKAKVSCYGGGVSVGLGIEPPIPLPSYSGDMGIGAPGSGIGPLIVGPQGCISEDHRLFDGYATLIPFSGNAYVNGVEIGCIVFSDIPVIAMGSPIAAPAFMASIKAIGLVAGVNYVIDAVAGVEVSMLMLTCSAKPIVDMTTKSI